MKILFIHLDDGINTCPPAINVIENLLDQGHEVFLVSYSVDELDPEVLSNNKFKYYDLGKRKNPSNNIQKYLARYHVRQRIRKFIARCIKNYDLVWTTSEITIREVGPVLFKAKKHVMQLMELARVVPVFGGHEQFYVELEPFAQKAFKVVVPEINRAYIVKTWWHLNTLPTVLPNKPYKTEIKSISNEAQKIINIVKQERRKIILYQGGFTADRKFDQFAEAVDKLGDDYCLYFMGKDNDYRKEICLKYPFIKYVGALKPPEHLLIAKYAYVGILTYMPVKDGFHSELNALYCAPNKSFEYALCNLPMIGTDVPGLQEIFHEYNVGVCIKEESADGVIEAIRHVDQHYEEMKQNCSKYFDSVDLKEIVRKIVFE